MFTLSSGAQGPGRHRARQAAPAESPASEARVTRGTASCPEDLTAGVCARPARQGRSVFDSPLPPIPLSQVGRAAHDLGLAGLLGGNLFGRLALHPSVTEISDQEERGKVVNAAWKRYGTVNSLSLLAVVTGWAGARAAEARDHRLLARGAPAGPRPRTCSSASWP